MKNFTCAVTGHRDIPHDKKEYVIAQLYHEILQTINDNYRHFMSGFAKGTDLMFASVVTELKDNYPISLEAALPYRARLNTPDNHFQDLIFQCDKVTVYSEAYAINCFMKRNYAMVEQSKRIIAIYDGREKGGTFATLNYARKMGNEIILINI